MASMITGDFVEAYVRKNACKEEIRRAEASTAGGVAAAQGDKKAGASASSEKKAAKEAVAGSNKGEGGSSLFGLMKKKVHAKVGGSTGASS
ncbi:unnamed protein product [Miscanthus lutarioriparius]|uniref:Uncharacterized protein n=1 Tax=Miscanthus lutarioriparius TaxID=422564 RepID=A0A811SM48_9POAL|nr:unnamed protein product [Miscanthus lutarioriparius]